MERLQRATVALVKLLERVLNQVLEAEMIEHVGVEPHEPTQIGEEIGVPRPRIGGAHH